MTTAVRKRKAPASSGAVQRCLDAYYDSFVWRFNPEDIARRWLDEKRSGIAPARRSVPQDQVTLPLINGGKDGALAKKLVQAYGEARALRLFAEFVWLEHPRVVRSDYSIGALFALAPTLVVDEAGRLDERTASNLDAGRRATGRGSVR